MLNFKMRLYPTAEQERRIEETCEVNRIVYNYFVLNKFRSRNDMNYALTELKEQQPVLRKYHSKMLQMISTKVAGALSALDELKKRGHAAGNGELQLLKPGECNSFVYNQTGYRIETCGDGKALLWLAKMGHIEIRIHECPVCGAVLDRDHNSSMVVDDRGRTLLGLPMLHREVTPADDRGSVAEAGTSPRRLRVGS